MRCHRHHAALDIARLGGAKSFVREGNLNTEQNSYELLIVFFILFHLCMQIPKDHLHSASPKAPGFRFSCIFTCHIVTCRDVGMSGCSCSVVLLGHGGHAGWNGWNGWNPPPTPVTPATGDPSGRSGEKPRPWYVSKVNRSNSFESSSQVHPVLNTS